MTTDLQGESLDLVPERRIIEAGLVEKGAALLGGSIQCLFEQASDPIAAGITHPCVSVPSASKPLTGRSNLGIGNASGCLVTGKTIQEDNRSGYGFSTSPYLSEREARSP